MIILMPRMIKMIILMLRMIRMIMLMLRMIILMGQDDGFPTPPHPTPPHPKWHFLKFTGRSQLLGVPMAWRRRRRQAMARRGGVVGWGGQTKR